MAVITVVIARQVSRILAGRGHAVMARAAGTHYLGVVNGKGRRPYIRVVAVFADIARLNVRGALARGFRAVVATEAVASDIHVIEICR